MKRSRALRAYFVVLGSLAVLALVLGMVWFLVGPRSGDASGKALYLLRDHAGQVALYAPDGSGPLAEYQIYTRLLPEQDVLALQQGVPVSSDAELQRRLEDYGL